MNFKAIKYKAVALGVATMLFSSGCQDFLERDIEDGYSTESVQTFQQYLNLAAGLYGGSIWTEFNTKFTWVVNEGLSGNLYSTHQDEGAIFKGNVTNNNLILEAGFISLYSGVISASNFIINQVRGSSLSESEKNQIEAEARMFRGMAYFLLTEYWGEVPLVRNNQNNIANKISSSSIPRANRATLYAAIEEDWKFAEQWLPEQANWGPKGGRVSKWGAKGMLAKLYLTMASCQAQDVKYKYSADADDARGRNGLYDEAIKKATEVIDRLGGLSSNYADIFDFSGNVQALRHSRESLFAIHFSDFGYNDGAHFQAQFASDEFWGTIWGTAKSLSYDLINSFDKVNDTRMRTICWFEGADYFNYRNEKAPAYEKDQLGAAPVLNNIKKFVYGYKSSNHPTLSCPMRLDFLRLADVYLIRAEAKMGRVAGTKDPTSEGMEDLAIVLNRAGKGLVTFTEIAHYAPAEQGTESYTYAGNNSAGNPMSATVEIPVYKKTKTDLIQERRKEFAIEGQSWLDLKRLYYRNPADARNYLKEQQREWRYTRKWGAGNPDNALGTASLNLGFTVTPEQRGYVRVKLYEKMRIEHPEIGMDPVSPSSVEVDLNPTLTNGTFDMWLPIPGSISLSPEVKDFREDLANEAYMY